MLSSALNGLCFPISSLPCHYRIPIPKLRSPHYVAHLHFLPSAGGLGVWHCGLSVLELSALSSSKRVKKKGEGLSSTFPLCTLAAQVFIPHFPSCRHLPHIRMPSSSIRMSIFRGSFMHICALPRRVTIYAGSAASDSTKHKWKHF